jgi:hypothetical protein
LEIDVKYPANVAKIQLHKLAMAISCGLAQPHPFSSANFDRVPVRGKIISACAGNRFAAMEN